MRLIAFIFVGELARFINLYYNIDAEYDQDGLIFFGILFLIMDIIEVLRSKS